MSSAREGFRDPRPGTRYGRTPPRACFAAAIHSAQNAEQQIRNDGDEIPDHPVTGHRGDVPTEKLSEIGAEELGGIGKRLLQKLRQPQVEDRRGRGAKEASAE